ncbi:hypothetical protein FDF54_01525 [Clostridium botulinum]|uniref:hypothetical protein n=1 Tax=Clostridium botulinum TaxID=1491 RepID=UPI0012AB9E33|nr:hypothetical protein [Clostridium botulinum]MBY6935896.1 hypothetical protein [Clostridium botulinum]NFM67357.1 hypothetical protein [Clostridium botulinum]NFM97594.1 hypothetical protein [Clostridium botulinum]NFN66057.1 hypothetical protein [Clostridium botulinum]NFR38664.1 hypothetical protein [Clostridium botulinum]
MIERSCKTKHIQKLLCNYSFISVLRVFIFENNLDYDLLSFSRRTELAIIHITVLNVSIPIRLIMGSKYYFSKGLKKEYERLYFSGIF